MVHLPKVAVHFGVSGATISRLWKGSRYFENLALGMPPAVKSRLSQRGRKPKYSDEFFRQHMPAIPITRPANKSRCCSTAWSQSKQQ